MEKYNLVLFSSMSPYCNLRNMRKIKKKMQEMFMRKFGTLNPKVGYIDSGYDLHMGGFQSFKHNMRIMFGTTEASFLDLTVRYTDEDRDEILSCDVIYLAGGNTFEFLAYLKYREMIKPLQEFAKTGMLLGSSAGSIIMTNDIVIAHFADKNDIQLQKFGALKLTNFLFKPHWDSGSWGRYIEQFKAFSKQRGCTIYGCNEGDAIIIDDGELFEYGDFMKITNGEIVHSPLDNW